ncbi:hypothetical protein BYT27DRAFT_7216015 [Phlegmacium glaucopus]|nr:hypothetical protein BYT27DRAFT_7216015 [Phlegmacium glaucopus]
MATLAIASDGLVDLLLSSGLPAYSVNVETGKILSDGNKRTVLFAEATTCQLEFKHLAKLTGIKDYYERVETAMDVFYRANVTNGLFHDQWSMKDGKPSGQHFTIGATVMSISSNNGFKVAIPKLVNNEHSHSPILSETQKIHRWAAHGLAYTCAVSYADQETGLGPDQMTMPKQGRRWMEVVDEWKSGGRQGDVPPGIGEPEPEKEPGKRDYYTPWPNA